MPFRVHNVYRTSFTFCQTVVHVHLVLRCPSSPQMHIQSVDSVQQCHLVSGRLNNSWSTCSLKNLEQFILVLLSYLWSVNSRIVWQLKPLFSSAVILRLTVSNVIQDSSLLISVLFPVVKLPLGCVQLQTARCLCPGLLQQASCRCCQTKHRRRNSSAPQHVEAYQTYMQQNHTQDTLLNPFQVISGGHRVGEKYVWHCFIKCRNIHILVSKRAVNRHGMMEADFTFLQVGMDGAERSSLLV